MPVAKSNLNMTIIHIALTFKWLIFFCPESIIQRELRIELPLNGFTCISRASDGWRSVFPFTHQSRLFLVLNDSCYYQHFPQLLTFAKQYLSVPRVYCLMFYNIANNVLELKVSQIPNGNDRSLLFISWFTDNWWWTEWWLLVINAYSTLFFPHLQRFKVQQKKRGSLFVLVLNLLLCLKEWWMTQ